MGSDGGLMIIPNAVITRNPMCSRRMSTAGVKLEAVTEFYLDISQLE